MVTCELLIARHGQTEWNRLMRWQGGSNIPLNVVGIRQAQELGKSMLDKGIEHIYSSDLSRAKQTADIVAQVLGISDVRTDDRLRERYLGRFEGWYTEDVARFAGIPLDTAHTLENDVLGLEKLPGVEPFSSFTERIWEKLNEIPEEIGSGKCLVVAHGAVMRAISFSADRSGNPRLTFENTEILQLAHNDGSWQVV